MQPDLYLQCPDGRQLVCHKVVLSRACPRLNTVLSGGDFTASVLPILGVDSAALEAVVGSFYTGSCGITASNVAAVYDAAAKLEVHNVMDACSAFLTNSLTADNWCTVMQGSISHKVPVITQQCRDFAHANFDAIVSSPGFLSSYREVVDELLGRSREQPRAAVLQAALSWLNHDPDIRLELDLDLLPALGLSTQTSEQQQQQQHDTQWGSAQAASQPQQAQGLQDLRCASALDPSAIASSSAPTLMSLLEDQRPGAEEAGRIGEFTPLTAAAGGSGRGVEGGRGVLIPNGQHQRLGTAVSAMGQEDGTGVESNGRWPGPGQELGGGEGTAGDEAAGSHGGRWGGRGASVSYLAAAGGKGRATKRQRDEEGEPGPHGSKRAAGEAGFGTGLATGVEGVAAAQASELLSLLLQQQDPQQQQPGLGLAGGGDQAPQDAVQQALGSGGLDSLRQLLSLAAPPLEQQQQQLAFSDQGFARLSDGPELEALALQVAGIGSSNLQLLQSLRRQDQQLQGHSRGLGSHGALDGLTDLHCLPMSSMLLGLGSQQELPQAPYGMVGLGDARGCGGPQAGGRGQQQQREREARQRPGGVVSKGTCHVDNCTADLAGLREYHLRYKICEFHLKAASIIKDGLAQRFCQQCGRFHTLDAFDGTRRSCRTMLQRHNARRAKKPVDPMGAGGGMEGSVAPPAVASVAASMAALNAMTAVSGLGEDFLRTFMHADGGNLMPLL